MTDVATLADKLVAAKEEVEKAKEVLKAAEDAFAATELELSAAMQAAGDSQIKANGRYVTLKTTRRFGVLSANKDALYAALRVNAPDLVKETVHAASLNKLALEMEANAAPPPWWSATKGLLEEKTSAEVTVTKSKPKLA